jgi:class 3 adenylate cyclase/tetratricopeptide (TPR) repeat protein
MQVCPGCGSENPDGKRFCSDCAAPLEASGTPREQRKIVTVLFCDLTGSTALGERLDPEPLRALVTRYLERMRGIVERHGGTVDKFMGDAVMAVFGVPVVHEDDALRAVRAAVEMRAAFPELGVEARIGVNTGLVVAGAGELLSDAVNVAARLQAAAAAGEIVIGTETHALVRDAVSVEDLEPLVLKGKRERVVAFRLLAVDPGAAGVARRLDSSMVGRKRELALLEDVFSNVIREGCASVTLLGVAGVGKSRLVREFLSQVDARVVEGRCVSYGEGITYWPVVEVVRQLGGAAMDALAESPQAAETLRVLLGEQDAVTSAEEIAWAVRMLFEASARERPFVVVFDDIHWAEPTFLDLIEHVADRSRDAPMLLLCVARPELLDRRPDWGSRMLNATTVRLEPLDERETGALIDQLLGNDQLDPDLAERIRSAAGGNPLFLEEMLAMVEASGQHEVVVPPTIKALLAARLDQLDPAERSVLERGSVEGQLFHRAAVVALAHDLAPIGLELAALVRKELVRPERPGGILLDDVYRFRHVLIRDSAYDALPKASRAELHERFADWLEQHDTDLFERDELLGYHLEQAYRYRAELAAADERTQALAERAAARLLAAGRRATARGDYHAIANLFERAVALGVVDARERARVQVELGLALWQTGRIAESEALLAATRDAAASLAERALADRALVHGLRARLASDPALGTAGVRAAAQEAIKTFEALGDSLGLAEAEYLLGQVLQRDGLTEEFFAVQERALRHAQVAEARGMTRSIVVDVALRLCGGPTPVPEAISRLRQLQSSAQDDRVLHAAVTQCLSFAVAMDGRFEAARAHMEACTPVLDEADETSMTWSTCRWLVHQMRQLVGDDAAAEEDLIAVWRHFRDARGEAPEARAIRAAAHLALLYGDQGRWQAAVDCLTYGEEVDLSPPVIGKAYTFLRLAARARVAAHLGRHVQALDLARTAVEIAELSDQLNNQARIWLALAEVQQAAGKQTDAVASVATALERYERKGNIAAAGRLCDRYQIASGPSKTLTRALPSRRRPSH